MAQEGIMSLPMGGGMQEGQGQGPLQVSSADSYDAAQTALGMVDPQGLAAVRDSLRQNISDLELTPAELDMVIEIFEYMAQRPDQYSALVKQLERQGIIDQGDMPEDYDPQLIGTILSLLNEMRMMRAEGAQAPMQMGPGAMPAPVAMAEGGLADVAQYLASRGRNGDTMLAHITPEEAQMLKRMGGSGTINPETGLPEFFIGKIFKAIGNAVKSVVSAAKQVLASPVGRIVGTIALAAVLGPTAIGMTLGTAGTAALSAGAVTLAGGGTLKEALVSGAMGYIGGGGTIGGFSPLQSLGGALPGAAGSALNTGLTTGALGTGAGLLMGMKPSDALRMGATAGITSGALQGLSNAQNLSDAKFARDAGMELTPAQARALQAESAAGAQPSTGPIGAARPVGAAGQVGTASQMLGQGLQPGSGGLGLQMPPTFGAPDFGPGPVGANLTPTPMDYSLAPTNMPSVGGGAGGQGIMAQPFGASDMARASGVGTGPSTNYSLSARGAGPAAPAAPQSMADKMVQGAKNIYNEYLSPDRPGLPKDAGILRRYGPLAAAGTAAIAAAGGMKSTPANPAPLGFNDADYIRESERRGRERTQYLESMGYGNYVPTTSPPASFVTPPSSTGITAGQIPVSPVPTVMPMGITQSPGGIMQPYNVAGLYGVPLLYGNVPGRARGGEMTMSDFPRKTGPINGPGTGTSDSIPAMLSDGEFVFTAKAVRNAGQGSRRKGAARMYKLMKMLEGGPVKGK